MLVEVGRRAWIHTALGLVSLPAFAVPPPRGSIALLLPILESRVSLAELTALVNSANTQREDVPRTVWQEWQGRLDGPPFTDQRLPEFERGLSPFARDMRYVPTVGNAWRRLTQRYEGALVYSGTLSAEDRKQCFPRPDEQCAQLQIAADLDFRDLLRNEVIDKLQVAEDELAFVAEGCSRVGATASSCSVADGGADGAAEALLAASRSFDRYLETVPADDVRKGMEIVSRTLSARSSGKVKLEAWSP
jgi:hypothetical protein